jgi:DNA invertase Pin-like site-specific DNA recombinase
LSKKGFSKGIDHVAMVTRIDRLARGIGDLEDIVRAVKAREASPNATEQPIDTGGAVGR